MLPGLRRVQRRGGAQAPSRLGSTA